MPPLGTAKLNMQRSVVGFLSHYGDGQNAQSALAPIRSSPNPL
ncbi:hypothetical protein Q31b_40160 [Novipirellula aureliae]|uniref:Uncharacterized protein n=1 Tax=Novipirellula aureliae TaxID=2527966 RepID=A0A5C6DQA8_9BACT|nr:hypothetical protein Q31b_40160 [Novipirellula aureliae]